LARRLRLIRFRNLSLADPFFDSLKIGYTEFPEWFNRKLDEEVYVVDDQSEVTGFVYLKREEGPVNDVEPALPDGVWLKVGTLKIVGRGTRLGERVLKKIFDVAISEDADGIYMTVFEVYTGLIELFETYGFRRHAIKRTSNGEELVLVRSLREFSGDLLMDYPFVHTTGQQAWLLAIYPAYHSRLLPDSILNNEPREIVQDVSYANTIQKVYIGRTALTRMSTGDAIVLYRTTDGKAPARYRSVATSICVVEEVRRKRDFGSMEEFIAYCRPRSVFSDRELEEQYRGSDRLHVVRMTYNAAFNRRITRGDLLDRVQIAEQPRWDLRELSQQQFHAIAELGGVNARVIID
jgi:hypothetical protein